MRIYGSVDLGGTKIAGVAATADREVVARQTIPTRAYEGPDAVLERIGALINDLARESGEQLEAVGVGLPGLLDLEEGVVKFLPNLYAHWRDVAVRDLLSARIGCPVYALNDARMATLGELAYGRGQGVETMAFFPLGMGVGGGVVNGDLHLGKLGAAGELGHQTILPNGPRCGCGTAGIGTLLFEKVREVVGQRVGMFPTDGVQIELLLLGDQAGAWRGIALAARGGYPIHRGGGWTSWVD